MFLVSGCGKTIILSNGGSDEINMTPYSSGKICTWLVKVRMYDLNILFKISNNIAVSMFRRNVLKEH